MCFFSFRSSCWYLFVFVSALVFMFVSYVVLYISYSCIFYILEISDVRSTRRRRYQMRICDDGGGVCRASRGSIVSRNYSFH